MPPSPSILTFPGSSHSRDTPNSHPYAIKTSSSAVLTRSNSTGHRYYINHHYTPVSPSKNSVGIRHSRYAPSHKHTRSLPFPTDDPAIPPPMPIPPSSTLPARLANQGYTKGDLGIVSEGERIPPTPPLTLRVKRSETLPSVFPNKTDTETSLENLPRNPKTWTPSQLSVYLSSALRLKGGAKLPVPVARDIGSFVMKEHLSGRAFLRLNKEDYDALGINQLWKDALFDASRTLRQNLMQGRIMGFESGPPQLSQSTEELQENDPLPAYGPLDLTCRRTPSSVPRQWEQDKKRMSKTSFRVGRVRGMVETYERSFSESSASGSECEEQEDVLFKFGVHQLVCEPEEGGFASGEETSASDGDGNATMVSGTESASNKVPVENNLAFVEKVAEPPSPPSVEALLREHEGGELQSDQAHSWGAKAWEDEANNPTDVHATAKRILLDTHTVSKESRPRVADITESAGTGNAHKGLTELFSQLTIEESPPLQTTRDIGVSAGDGVNTPAPGPAVYEKLHAIQKRLEIVETRLHEMERSDAEKDTLLQQAQDEVKQCQNIAPAKHDSLDVASEPSHLSSSGLPHHAEQKKNQQTTRNYAAADPSITELPRYMFLVSLGVVAITTRVVLQRMIGDRKRS